MKLSPDAKIDSTPIEVKFNSAKKFNYYGDFDEVEIADLNSVKSGPTFGAADGSCDNFALEYHLKIRYEPIANSPAAAGTFKITEASVDVVYGKIVPPTATTPVQITRRTSVHFYTGVNTRQNSGSPGYIKGMPLKTGILSTALKGADPNSKAYVVEPVSGFYLRGAKNTGECILTKLAGNPGFVEPQKISYFEDPQLTFDDSIIYGCYLDLTFSELKTFCESQ
jgi:hypothetical protein